MIRREGDRMMVAGPVTLQNVTNVFEEGLVHVRAGVSVVDLAEVSALDSSLLATTLAWIREARLASHLLTFANLPKGLQTLAQLYGVEELLPVANPR